MPNIPTNLQMIICIICNVIGCVWTAVMINCVLIPHHVEPFSIASIMSLIPALVMHALGAISLYGKVWDESE